MTIADKLRAIRDRRLILREAYIHYRTIHPDWPSKRIIYEIRRNSGYSKNTIYRILK